MAPLLEIAGLIRDYPLPRRSLRGGRPVFRALHGVDLAVPAGESHGLVGESGCGKSTLARLAMALDRPTGGTVRFDGTPLFELPRARLRRLRHRFQMVFQDPMGSLDPRQRIGRIVAEPLAALAAAPAGRERRDRVVEVLGRVGLGADVLDRYPHEFSGGQRQRIAIARALVTEPDLLVADEPVSALDVSVQAQVLNLFLDIRDRMGLAMLFVSHDLGVVRYLTDRVSVMYLGRIVERGPTADLFATPAHPYTRLLLDAMPKPDPARRRRGGAPAVAEPVAGPGDGCPFAPRCPRAEPRCRAEAPVLREVAADRLAACHVPLV